VRDENARLQGLEDIEAIRDLMYEYGQYLDAKDWVAYADLFTEDGEIAAPTGVALGREAIRAMSEEKLSDMPHGFHLFLHPRIHVAGDRATSTSIWLTLVASSRADKPAVTQAGTYRDELARVASTWRFRRREVVRQL
jgi:uncharacterized protein (TIGR02246 family)